MNLHALGEKLLGSMRSAGAAHSVSLKRGSTQVGPFAAASPPIGHELITETGIDISDQNRDFYFEASVTGVLGAPRIGDVIVDHADNSKWRILPQNNDYAWNWHGQFRSAYKVTTKQDDKGIGS